MRTRIIGSIAALVLLVAATWLVRERGQVPPLPPAIDVGFREALAHGEVSKARLSMADQVRPALIPSRADFESDPIALESPGAVWTAIGFEEANRHGKSRLAFRVTATGPRGDAILTEVATPADFRGGRWHPVQAALPSTLGWPVRLRFSVEDASEGGLPGAVPRVAWAAPRLLTATDEKPPNVLLIVLDTLRADRTSVYGYGRRTTPFLEDLASRGAMVTEMIASYPTTLPSHWAMFSGFNTPRHGSYRPGLEGWPSGMVPLAERLRRAGYLTAAFTEGGYVQAAFGLSQGFDLYDDGPFAREIDARDSVAVTFDEAARWIEGNRGASFFVFLQTYEVHTPYTPPREILDLFETDYAGRYAEAYPARAAALVNTGKILLSAAELAHVSTLYDAEIRHLDRALSELWRRLEATGALEDTLVVITSDHGEDMMEHGWLHHGTTLYDPALRVPFVALWPGRIPAGARLECQRSLVDLTPTLLDLLGLEAAPAVDGESFAKDLLRGGCRSSSPAFFELRNATWAETSDLPAAGLRDDHWKYIARLKTGSDELYDLEQDPGEKVNLIGSERERVDAMRGRILAIFASGSSRSKPSEKLAPEVEDRLRSLGYLE
jgi:arylsulfatase A-like enzyme